MAQDRRVALFLTRQDEAQQIWVQHVRDEAKRNGYRLEEHWCEESIAQNRAISDCIYQDAADALIILPVSTSGPAVLLSQAASKGRAIILLNRLTQDLNPATSWSIPRLRKEYPGVLIVRVAPDEIGIGRLQGRQILTLLPHGGTVLYVQGNMMTSGAVDRTAGLEEELAGHTAYDVGKIDGGWTSPRAEAALSTWLDLRLIDVNYRPRLIVSQSEVMVAGIRTALAKAATQFSRPELADVPITACDGMATFKREVDGGRLLATIEVAPRTIKAMSVLNDFWTHGTIPAEYEVLLPPASYPKIEELARRAL